ncbi:DUF2000 domain-containing protein [Streptomyces sp. CB03911]|uniref:DUF2000 domain-containing protein n=1 Tax=Streptomycetaceae TaxID=2062 RepID=UPI00093BD0A8|nr:DUF2000 domain-containing protein [Streptomyces sp. CB03911]OKI13339.1 hypothetical protein A6A07_15675 [Streptomyces sp. CB03911]
MSDDFEKCAIVVDKELPAGLAMNTVAALSLSVGKFVDGIVGDDVKDADGRLHTGITAIPLPVLKADASELRDIVVRAAGATDVFLVDFTAVAQSSRSYDEYTRRTAEVPTAELPYIGVAVCGSKAAVNRLTGSLPLYR